MLYAPFDTNVRIIPADTAVRFRRVVVVCLIQKFHMICKCDEAMTEASGNEKLFLIFVRELYAYPLFICGAVMAQIYRHIQHRAAHTSHELGLRFIPFLKMDSPQSPFHSTHGMIILHKIIK